MAGEEPDRLRRWKAHWRQSELREWCFLLGLLETVLGLGWFFVTVPADQPPEIVERLVTFLTLWAGPLFVLPGCVLAKNHPQVIAWVGVLGGLAFAAANLVLGGLELAMASSLLWVPNCCFGLILRLGYRSFAGAQR